MKRRAQVPEAVARLGRMVSKADLLEAAYWLADRELENEDEAFSNLLAELNTHRKSRGQRPLSVVKIISGKSARDFEREAKHGS